MARYWTSDTHFGHHNVIEYCQRPFASVYHMNQALIDNWNSRVDESDNVVFLGDWAMNPKFVWVLKYLKFKRLDWILGNHDNENKIRKLLDDENSEIFHLRDKVALHKSMLIDIQGTLFYCVHRPIQGSDEYPVLCGHVHEKWKFLPAGSTISEHSRSKEAKVDIGIPKVIKTPILNVGCDQHNFTPISDDQVLEYFR